MHRRRRTALLLAATLATAAPLLTACGDEAHPGAAAVVGDDRITVSQLENRVKEVRTAQRDAIPNDTQYKQAIAQSGGLTREILNNMVLDRVLHSAAQDAGVTVSRKEVTKVRGELEDQPGGVEQLERDWLQTYGIPPERIDENLRLQLEAQKLAAQLGTDTSGPAFWKALSDASKKLDVDLNPRYGTWDPEKNSRVEAELPWLRQVTQAGGQETA